MKRISFLILAVVFLFSSCAAPAFEDGVLPTVEISGTASLSSELPEQTAGLTAVPKEQALPSFDEELFVLINLTHPLEEETEGVLLAPLLTSGNVTCDERRHANERAARALNEMLHHAEAEGEFHFIIASAFRRFWEQELLWNNFVSEHPGYAVGPVTEPVSAMPRNCSEHSTGLAFDILCEDCPHGNPAFVSTREGRWLLDNAWKYGFILRYPADKQLITLVVYEPWHYRYVGVEAARFMHDNGLCLEEFLELYQ